MFPRFFVLQTGGIMTRILSGPLIRKRFHREFVEVLFRSHRDQKRFNRFKNMEPVEPPAMASLLV